MLDQSVSGLSVADGMEFMKRMWGGMSVPSLLMPTADLDELDKRIADLKAVEQWLQVNLGMLKASIQGLEVQRNTVAALKSFGEDMARSADESN